MRRTRASSRCGASAACCQHRWPTCCCATARPGTRRCSAARVAMPCCPDPRCSTCVRCPRPRTRSPRPRPSRPRPAATTSRRVRRPPPTVAPSWPVTCISACARPRCGIAPGCAMPTRRLPTARWTSSASPCPACRASSLAVASAWPGPSPTATATGWISSASISPMRRGRAIARRTAKPTSSSIAKPSRWRTVRRRRSRSAKPAGVRSHTTKRTAVHWPCAGPRRCRAASTSACSTSSMRPTWTPRCGWPGRPACRRRTCCSATPRAASRGGWSGASRRASAAATRRPRCCPCRAAIGPAGTRPMRRCSRSWSIRPPAACGRPMRASPMANCSR